MASVLVVYKELPAPSVGHAGGKAVFRVIEFLCERGHKVSLVARVRREEAPLIAELKPFCDRLDTVPHHQAIGGPIPLAFLRSYLALRSAAARALRQVQPDLLHIEVTQTAFALLGIPRPFTSFRALDVNWFLLQQRASQARGTKRLLARLGARILRWVEPWLCRRFDVIATISQGDHRLLAPRCGARPVVMLPLAASFTRTRDVNPAVPLGPNVLFVGAMYRSLNVEGVEWFLESVWPKVLERVPEARFYVVGYDPPQRILDRQDGEHVFVVGFAEELAPWYRAAAVSVSPLPVAGGLLQKVVDAMAVGTAVVATPTSNHGLGATEGEHLLIADTPEAFAEAVVHLLAHPAERERLGQAGQRFVLGRYDLQQALHHWEVTCGIAEKGAMRT